MIFDLVVHDAGVEPKDETVKARVAKHPLVQKNNVDAKQNSKQNTRPGLWLRVQQNGAGGIDSEGHARALLANKALPVNLTF